MFGNHKDETPFNTIQKIRSILADLDIFVVEEMWNSVGDNNFSVRIVDNKIPEVGTNGKGITKEFALASAYAEYMERLQSGCLYYRAYGTMKETYHECPDEKVINNKTYIPFYNVFKQDVKYLPKTDIYKLCGSNGLCAGNSFEEAMSQGLGEIYERFLIKTIFLNPENEYPCIDLEDFKNYECFSLIEYLLDKGFFIQFRDLTLNGIIPVLGVVIFNEERTKYSFNIASDPILETTIQRCITELFQGLEEDDIELYRMKDLSFSLKEKQKNTYKNKKAQLEHELIQTYLSGNGSLPDSFFNNNTKVSNNYKNAFLPKFTSNKNVLAFMLNVAKKMQWDIYVRDYNFLDFSTLRIYIPDVSEIYNLEETKKYNDILNFNKLLNVSSICKNDLSTLNQNLSEQEKNPSQQLLKQNDSSKFLNIYLTKNSDLSNTHYLVLKALINIKLGNYETAYNYLAKYLEDTDKQVENRKYYQAVLLFLNLKTKNFSEEEIFNNLILFFDKDLAFEIIADFKNEEDCFNYYSFPNCGNCDDCTEQSNCLYKEWQHRQKMINSKMQKSFPDQTKLVNYFKNVTID